MKSSWKSPLMIMLVGLSVAFIGLFWGVAHIFQKVGSDLQYVFRNYQHGAEVMTAIWVTAAAANFIGSRFTLRSRRWEWFTEHFPSILVLALGFEAMTSIVVLIVLAQIYDLEVIYPVTMVCGGTIAATLIAAFVIRGMAYEGNRIPVERRKRSITPTDVWFIDPNQRSSERESNGRSN